MERLTEKKLGNSYPLKDKSSSKVCLFTDYNGFYAFFEAVNRLGVIEDILGDEYDLETLRNLVNQRMTMREDVADRWKLTKGIPLDRLREIVESEKNGKLIFLPENINIHDVILVIETRSKTGLETQVWRNFVKGFSRCGIYYQHDPNCSVYHEYFDDFEKTWFLSEEEAETALKERMKKNGTVD